MVIGLFCVPRSIEAGVNLVPRIEPPVSVRKQGTKVQRRARAGGKSCGWWVVLCATCVLQAQSQPHAQRAQRTARPEPAKTRLAPKLVTADDGLAILSAALAGRYKVQGRSDCSHLVHTVYEKAGFPYKYETSSDLYAGIDEFRQVARPQPGDVVVWPGHAGIVVSPAQHTFYSALRSGFGVQPYDSIYWKGRGRPHFFRYVKATPAPATAPVLSAANHTPSLKPAGLRNASAVGPVPAVVLANAAAPEDDPAAEAPEGQLAIPAIPTTVVIQAVRLKPEQVSDALWQQFRETGENLQSQDVFRLRAALVACRRVQVQKLHVKGNTGAGSTSASSILSCSREPGRPRKSAGRCSVGICSGLKTAGNWDFPRTRSSSAGSGRRGFWPTNWPT